MPKKQKRFKSEQAILKAIDAATKKQQDHEWLAAELESEAKAMAMLPGAYKLVDIEWKRKLARAANRSAQRAANKKVELGKALSAMRTMLLNFPDNEDTSVTL